MYKSVKTAPTMWINFKKSKWVKPGCCCCLVAKEEVFYVNKMLSVVEKKKKSLFIFLIVQFNFIQWKTGDFK